MGANDYNITYSVDMVFCIDTTGSMYPILGTVKKNALNFYNDVVRVMAEKNKNISQLRIKVIAFRDYIADGEEAMLVTDFFDLPSQNPDFECCVNSLTADGGGDEPEDGLEALAYAMKSKWNPDGMKKRQVIVVWTDASTHPLGYGRSEENYPKNMAANFQELTEWWGDRQNPGVMNQSAKRLLLFAPEERYWGDITDNWDNVIHFPSKAGKGLEEVDYGQIIDAISNTI
ncbi:MAG: VWA domain-containing protein [Lachnospiraceae bacterium]|nr:VWA domain-containing protein [Lachnospiraceae bacterium]MDD3616648.1 VWA domain-containing protein [Lachnospiraceae bacterium]